jgi:hypothetical protein
MLRACTLLLVSSAVLPGQYPSGIAPPAAAPVHTPPSIGLSGPSIGLSGKSIGLRAPTIGTSGSALRDGVAAPAPFAMGTPVQHGRGSNNGGHGQNDGRRGKGPIQALYGLPLPFYGLPYLAADDSAGGSEGDYPTNAQQSGQPGDENPVLGEQVRQLSLQITDLQNQMAQKGAADLVEAAPTQDAAAAPPVTVVLRDGKKIQVQSYAVMGDTFWDFSSQPGHKIPIADIDIPASAKASEANGAEFPKISSGS